MDISQLTIKSTRLLLDQKELSSSELRSLFLEKITQDNPGLNAYLSVIDKDLPHVTEDAKNRILAGVPCAIKDNMLIKDHIATAGSKILESYIAAYDATAVHKLRHAGALFLGKTNLDEFAMGASGENSAFGATANPHDLTRVAGGSSSGSAAAVASGLAVYALGSDTGGSIRCPASYCGVVGLKPTYGRVSRHGLIAMASSLDQIGPLTKNVEDAAIVLNALAGHDALDATSSPKPVPDYTVVLGDSIKGLKIGVPREFFSKGLEPRSNTVIQNAIKKLESLGATIDEISLPHTEAALATYYIIVPSEVSSNLARFDGVRYGLSVQKPDGDLLDIYKDTRAEGFGDEVRRRIILGTYVLSAGYYDAYYLKAQKVRTLIKQDFDRLFETYDVIVGPTTPTVAPRIGAVTDPLEMYLADIYTVQANLAGLPALSMPCGFIEEDGKQLPVGFQIMGKHFDESRVLQVAYALEQSLSLKSF